MLKLVGRIVEFYYRIIFYHKVKGNRSRLRNDFM